MHVSASKSIDAVENYAGKLITAQQYEQLPLTAMTTTTVITKTFIIQLWKACQFHVRIKQPQWRVQNANSKPAGVSVSLRCLPSYSCIAVYSSARRLQIVEAWHCLKPRHSTHVQTGSP